MAVPQLYEPLAKVLLSGLWGTVEFPADSVHSVDVFPDDLSRTLDVPQPTKLFKGSATGDVYSAWGQPCHDRP